MSEFMALPTHMLNRWSIRYWQRFANTRWEIFYNTIQLILWNKISEQGIEPHSRSTRRAPLINHWLPRVNWRYLPGGGKLSFFSRHLYKPGFASKRRQQPPTYLPTYLRIPISAPALTQGQQTQSSQLWTISKVRAFKNTHSEPLLFLNEASGCF